LSELKHGEMNTSAIAFQIRLGQLVRNF